MKSVVGEKGQVTIPKALRDSLGLRPGSELEFHEEGGCLVARRVHRVDPFEALVGILPRFDVDATLADLRGPSWSEEIDRGKVANRRR